METITDKCPLCGAKIKIIPLGEKRNLFGLKPRLLKCTKCDWSQRI